MATQKCPKAKGVFPQHNWQTTGANPKIQTCQNGCGQRRATPKVQMKTTREFGKKGWTETQNPKREINAWAGGKLARQTPDGNETKSGCGKTVKQTVGFISILILLPIFFRKWSKGGKTKKPTS